MQRWQEEHGSRRQAGAGDAGGSPSPSGRSADDDGGASSEPDVDMQVPWFPAPLRRCRSCYAIA